LGGKEQASKKSNSRYRTEVANELDRDSGARQPFVLNKITDDEFKRLAGEETAYHQQRKEWRSNRRCNEETCEQRLKQESPRTVFDR
jgi:hypothetical protein